ncbi:MAG TPA: sodium:proton antiporter [Candidatus Kapabacteria bacterium]|nr:sodium:proton antiporter [Candidatus Kapabacteria bacterium]
MELTNHVPLWSILPFAIMLLSIAVLPLVANHFWENNRNKLIISIILSIPTIIFLLTNNLTNELIHSVVYDYIPFLILLGSLFIITGGIFIKGDIEATPRNNTIFLLIGAVLASFIGTTGAAMLLIRPLISTNSQRKHKVHTILFFIAAVANCGGLLTPLGDPPLFMMYLRGVDFLWFLTMWKEWIVANGLLLIIYFVVDTYYVKKEPDEIIRYEQNSKEKISISGKLNFLFLLGVLLAVALINSNNMHIIKEIPNLAFLRELVLIAMSGLSLYFTAKTVRKDNNFTWEPIEEIAFIFLGIFVTMVPALEYLKINAVSLGIQSPEQFYYFTGLLSSLLDNTPTAVTFYNLELGLIQASPEFLQTATKIVAGITETTMIAICNGAVFFGAMTYIGNGPNFMVKAIAESQGIKMPDFFAYIYKFSLLVLLPIFILIQILFIR